MQIFLNIEKERSFYKEGLGDLLIDFLGLSQCLMHFFNLTL